MAGTFEDEVLLVRSLLAWYDASQIAGRNDGDRIPALGDMSGRAQHLTALSNGPFYRATGHDGLPTMEFSGSDSILGASSTLIPYSDFTILAVLYVWTSGRPFGTENDGSGNNGLGLYNPGTPTWIYRNSGSNFDFSISFNVASPVVLALRSRRSQYSVSNANFNRSTTTGNVWTDAGQNFKLGGSGNGGSNFAGKISEWMVFGRPLEDDELARLIGILSYKWGGVFTPTPLITSQVLDVTSSVFTTDLSPPFLNVGVGVFTPGLVGFIEPPFLNVGVGLSGPTMVEGTAPPFVPPSLPPTLVPGTAEGPGVPLPPLSAGGLAGIRFYQGPPWRWVVTDLESSTLTFLDRLAAEAVVTYTLDKGATARLSVPAGNPEVNILADDGDPFVSEGNRLLYGFRREGGGPGDSIWKCRFAGRILLVEDQGLTEDARTTITAYDPWHLMYQRPMVNYDNDFPDKAGFFSFDDTQVGGIAGLFLRNTILNQGELGIDMGDTTPTWSTDNAQPTPNPVPLPGTPYWGGPYDAVWSGRTKSVIETTTQLDTDTQQGLMVGEVFDLMVSSGAVDFLLTPIYDPVRRPGYTHELSIYNRAGVEASDAIFAWDKPGRNLTQINSLRDGTKRANTIRYYAETGGPPVGGGIPIADGTSILKYGESWHEEFWPGRIEAAALAMAELQLELMKNGIHTVEVTPSPERAPFVFSEYWLGDTVPVYASNKLRQEIAGFQRIYGIVLNIDENSYEQLPSLLVSPDSA